MVYIYHDIYHLPLLYTPWYIPKVVYTTYGVVYTMRQPSRWTSLVTARAGPDGPAQIPEPEQA
jgi:hypothetical protein